MNSATTPLGITKRALPGRYIFRLMIVLCSLLINSWAIASFVPAHQANSTQTKLSVSDLSLRFVTPAPPKLANETSEKKVKQAAKNQTAKDKVLETKPIPQKKVTQNQIANKSFLSKAALEEATSQEANRTIEKPLAIDQMPKIPDQEAPVEVPSHESPSSANLAVNAAPKNPLISNPSFSAPPTQPRYPTLARKRGQEGIVWLEVWLDETGDQTKLLVSESSGISSLDKAAIKAVKQWQFQPHRHNSLAIAARVKIPVEFVLN